MIEQRPEPLPTRFEPSSDQMDASKIRLLPCFPETPLLKHGIFPAFLSSSLFFLLKLAASTYTERVLGMLLK